jgi:hypothetical protein
MNLNELLEKKVILKIKPNKELAIKTIKIAK